jgi:hypothetical protein
MERYCKRAKGNDGQYRIYFSHADWPKGRMFVVGHTLLTLLFSFLALSYGAVFVWNVWLKTNG